MAVYDERPHLEQAVESILNQTFEDFEFIIINDGSTDGSKDILDKFAGQDERIRVVHQENRGLIKSLNRGVDMARGQYIARMDGDDISYPERLEYQVQFLHRHSNVGVVGTNVEKIDAEGRFKGSWSPPTEPEIVSWKLLFNTCLCHPSVVIRQSLLEALGGYAEWAKHAEDYELWTRAVQVSQLSNIPDTLLKLRRHDGSVTVSKRTEQIRLCEKVAGNLHRVLLREKARKWISEFLVWMEVEGVDRAAAETSIQDLACVHEYLRAIYEACVRRLLPKTGSIRVRQHALVKLDQIAARIAKREGWVEGMRHKVRARGMAPVREIFPWALQAVGRRLS
ncbi:glycosyltransferase [Salinibacter altiplanensis]|uniref:glycosyltransferase n=1 Tax=Salinibacter altiplanensis TaxID=1803181 RepID=UPI0013000430|nr:glycosyltransferase [Salinibacter altiplanensis]